ncbi:MAG: flagellar hook-length control protein FliK [Sphingomonas sp.]
MFQVSLSTLLTPPAAPGAALPATLSGAFSATLAGMVTAPDGTEVGKSAPTARQSSAETGKSLPIETGENATLPASADDWLNQAEQAPARGQGVPLSIVGRPELTSGPIILSIAALLPESSENAPAVSLAELKARDQSKKIDDTAPAVDPRTIVVALPIVIADTPIPTAAPADAGIAPIAAMPVSTPALSDVPNITFGDNQVQSVSTPATDTAATVTHIGDAQTPAVTAAPYATPAAIEAPAQPGVALADAAPSPKSSVVDPVVRLSVKTPGQVQDAADRPAVARTIRHGDVRTATSNTTSRSLTSDAPDSSPTSSRASFQPAISGTHMPSNVAAAPFVTPTGETTPPASASVNHPDAIDSDKMSRPAAGNVAAPAPVRVATADTAPASIAPPQAAPAPLPAGMLFGIALDQRATLANRPSPRDEALQALSAIAGAGSAAPVVAAAGGTQHNALDMRRDDWPQAMIDRIDALRDAADATSTRITLVPDALGKVDVSLRHDGDTVHVHFAADTAQTRAMLADAQPRLADAAQARGIRLGQTSVGTGGGEAGRQPPRQPDAPMPSRPVSAAAASTDAASDSSRLA